jgi:hypothetical protein
LLLVVLIRIATPTNNFKQTSTIFASLSLND